MLGGAAGSLVDRLRDGAVTDWMHVAPYPPYFNVADLAVRGGLVAAAVVALCRYRRSDNPARTPVVPGPASKGSGAVDSSRLVSLHGLD